MTEQQLNVALRDALRDRRWGLLADLFVTALIAVAVIVLTYVTFGLLFVAGACSDSTSGFCSTRMQDNLTQDDLAAMAQLNLIVSLGAGLVGSALTLGFRRRTRARGAD
jgi:hypothetical protein